MNHSWPFDSVSWSDSQNAFIQVDKEAAYMIWTLQPVPSLPPFPLIFLSFLFANPLSLSSKQSWHSEVQHRYLRVYKWFSLIILGIMLYVLFLEPFKDFLKVFFFNGSLPIFLSLCPFLSLLTASLSLFLRGEDRNCEIILEAILKYRWDCCLLSRH
jgi:hypothetical protein